jgi:hypothetical protein
VHSASEGLDSEHAIAALVLLGKGRTTSGLVGKCRTTRDKE